MIADGKKDFVKHARIIYSSRTHSQLTQVQKELRNTVYKPRTVLIASRDHLCVNTQINPLKGARINAACRSLRKAPDPCVYFLNREKAKTDMSWDPLEIEELHNQAQLHLFCPYFAMKDRMHAADIILMPYNYLIDEKMRGTLDVQWENTIIIFDEAHNIAQATEEVTSFELKAESLQSCMTEITDLKKSVENNEQIEWESSETTLSKLHEITSRFFKFLTNFSLDPRDNENIIQLRDTKGLPEDCLILSGTQIFKIFFEGVTSSEIAKDGQIVQCSLREDWVNI